MRHGHGTRDAHERELAGEVSPHAAMVDAGFRPKTVTIQPTFAGFVALVFYGYAAAQSKDGDSPESFGCLVIVAAIFAVIATSALMGE